MHRIFFGLEIPAPIKDRLLKVRADVEGARWQSAEQMHLTLLFLGDVDEERLSSVCEAARHIPLAGFELGVVGLGCFGQPARPRNLWAGVQPTSVVCGLHDTLKNRMDELGFSMELRAFRPHITLARFKRHPGSVTRLLTERGETAFGSFLVDRFVLFASELRPEGSVYSVIERFALQS